MSSNLKHLFQEQKLANLQASLDGMNDSITKLENEISKSSRKRESSRNTEKFAGTSRHTTRTSTGS